MRKTTYFLWIFIIVGLLVFFIVINTKTDNAILVDKETNVESLKAVDIYQYSTDVILSMGFANEAKEILSDMSDNPNSNNLYSTTMETLVALRKASNKLRQAGYVLDNYASTTDIAINDNAENFRSVYSTLSVLLEISAIQNEQLLKSQDENGLADFVSNSSKTSVDIDEAWKLIPMATIEFANILVDRERLVEGKSQHLKINSAQREDLINNLDNTFGSEIKSGMKVGQLAIVASGALLRGFLTDEWKSSDE